MMYIALLWSAVFAQTPLVYRKQPPPQRGGMSIEKGKYPLPLQRSGMFDVSYNVPNATPVTD